VLLEAIFNYLDVGLIHITVYQEISFSGNTVHSCSDVTNPWNRFLLAKLVAAHLIKKYSYFMKLED